MRFAAYLLLLLPFVAACGSDEVDTSPTEPDPPAGVTDVDDLAPALEDAYELLDYEKYEKLLHEDFVFRMSAADAGLLGVAEMSAAEDLDATRAMFSGEFGLEPEIDPATGLPTGSFVPVPPVQTIEILLVPISGSDWEEVTGGEFAGAQRRVFDLDMVITHSGNPRIDQIRGPQILYVRQGTLRGDTSGTLYWQIRGWEDQGAASRRGSSAVTLGRLKARY